MLITTKLWFSANIDNKTRTVMEFSNNYNNYSDFSQELQPMWISLSLIFVIIFTVSGNSLVCIAVIRERNLQNTTNYFLTSLAFTDCLVACLVMPLAVTVELIGHFPFDAFACNVWSTFDICCCTSSIWHMSVMSLDRYLTLRYPLKYGRNKRRSLMAYKIITIWLISFAICLPLFTLGLVDSSNVYNEQTRGCFPTHRTFKIYGSFVAFFIPLIIMIITYALTMAALQQAHTTKKQRKKRRERIHAVLNLATMAIRWKRAVNSVEIPDKTKSTTIAQHEIQSTEKNPPKIYQRQRSSSLFTHEQPKNPIFLSSQRLNETSKSSSTINWNKNHEKQLKPLPKKCIERLSIQHLEPSSSSNNLQTHTKRSHSYTPLLDAEINRKDHRRSSSVHTLLQIRRDSAKISEELANLSAQLSASMNINGSNSKRPSLSVPRTTELDENHTPTIDQLIAQTNLLSTTFLTVNPKRRGRSHSADIRLPIFEIKNGKIHSNNAPVPNLLITHESIRNIPTNSNNTNDNNIDHLTFDTTYQRIKNWITVTASSTALNNEQNVIIPSRCASAINITENTPMLNNNKQDFPPLTNLKRYFPRIEQLYGQTSSPNSTLRSQQQQHLLVNDHVASAQNFAVIERHSICSITSSMLAAARRRRNNRPSTSSSIGSSSLQGTIRKYSSRPNERTSQASFQMVSLDTDDSSSCTSSLTQHSTTLQSAMAGTNTPISYIPRKKKQQRFRNLTKTSANNERKAMRVLLIIFSIFVLLWTPFFVINLLSCFITNIHPILISISTWLGYCSSCVNPIIYTIFSRAFRRAFYNILTCRKVIHARHSSSHSITLSAGRKRSSYNKGPIDLR